MRSGSSLGPLTFSQRAPASSGATFWAAGDGSEPVASDGETSLRPLAGAMGVICQYQPDCVTSNSGS